ncbi:hypothetical protein D9M72_215150 [compost metagenome]
MRAHQTRGARHAGNKKACRGGPPDRLFFLPEGWTSRRTRAWRLYTNHSTELTHSTAPAARAAEKRSSRSGLMSKSPSGQTENKKPGGLRPTGSCETQEAEPPGGKALGTQFGKKGAQRNHRGCAGHRCILRGQELLHGALMRLVLAATRWLIFGGERRLTPRWRSGNRGVARMQQWLRSASSQMPAGCVRGVVVQADADDGRLNDRFFARNWGAGMAATGPKQLYVLLRSGPSESDLAASICVSVANACRSCAGATGVQQHPERSTQLSEFTSTRWRGAVVARRLLPARRKKRGARRQPVSQRLRSASCSQYK